MPGGDRTGPMGMGSMTGRAAGLCTGGSVPGYANFVPGRGMGGRFGRGRCFGAGWHPGRAGFGWWNQADLQMPKDEEKELLKQQVGTLQAQLNAVTKRLDEMNSTSTFTE